MRANLRSWGSLAIAAFCLMTVAIWLSSSPVLSDPIVSTAKASAFLAITLLSIELVLSTRWSVVERSFDGLDSMYKAHKVVGKLTFVFIALHLALMLIWTSFSGPVLPLIVPGLSLAYSIGILAFLVLLILLLLTVSLSLPYQTWQMTHRLMVLPLVLALAHALSAGSDLQASSYLRYWIILVGAVGLFAYLYTAVLYRYLGPRAKYRVSSTRRLGDVTEITMDGALSFRPGQFAFIRFPRFEGIHEYHPFSISSGQGERLRISVKALGDYTREKVPQVRKGDEVMVRGPYGKFGERYLECKKDMVWVGGGIGITPFLSMVRHEGKRGGERETLLIWTFRDEREEVYHDELASAAGKLRYIPWPSRTRGRLSAERIAELLGGKEEMRNRTFFLCGPSVMMGDLANQLLTEGVRLRDIVFEDFSFL